MHQIGIGGEILGRFHAPVAGIGGESLPRPVRSQKAAEQQLQVVYGGAAAPETGAGGCGRVVGRVHEHGSLAVLGGAGSLEQRDADVATDVGEHAPEQAMRDVIKSIEPEQLLRPEQVGAEQTMRQEGDRQPARFGEGRQEQRVNPDQEAGAEAAHRPGTGAALPEDAADDRRRELRHGGKRDEPDRH